MITKIIYSEKSVARLIQIYRDKDKFRQLIELYASIPQEIEDTVSDMLLFRDVETAFGEQLDVIGRIVGQDRQIANADPFFFFGYAKSGVAPVGIGSFGTITNPAIGERYKSINEAGSGDVTLADSEYRLFIKARIIKNHTGGTLNEIIEATTLIAETDAYTIVESKMQIDINFTPGSLSSTKLNLLQNFDLLPRPAGVELNVTAV